MQKGPGEAATRAGCAWAFHFWGPRGPAVIKGSVRRLTVQGASAGPTWSVHKAQRQARCVLLPCCLRAASHSRCGDEHVWKNVHSTLAALRCTLARCQLRWWRRARKAHSLPSRDRCTVRLRRAWANRNCGDQAEIDVRAALLPRAAAAAVILTALPSPHKAAKML